jgi:beta-N-acetylhexosaminidase
MSVLVPALVVAVTGSVLGRADPGASRQAAATRPAAARSELGQVPDGRPSESRGACGTGTVLSSIGGRTALQHWSLTRLAEQTVVVPVDESDVASVTAEVRAGAGGVILFGTSAPADLGSSIAALVAAAPDSIGPLVMTDEEGGVVQRMANLVGSMPSARTMGKTLKPIAIEQLAEAVGRKMAAAGVNMDLAPVLDVDGGKGPDASNPDGTRSFSAVEPVAAIDGLAFASGLERAGVVPVVKHFPGLGGSTANTDVASASTPAWLLEQRIGLVPFERAVARHIPAVMVANALVPGLSTLPASLSPAVVTGILRDRLHFSGLVLTDSLSAVAIRDAGYSVPRAAVAALRAGDDMVLYDESSSTADLTSRTVGALVTAVQSGALARARLVDAVAHVLGVKRATACS